MNYPPPVLVPSTVPAAAVLRTKAQRLSELEAKVRELYHSINTLEIRKQIAEEEIEELTRALRK